MSDLTPDDALQRRLTELLGLLESGPPAPPGFAVSVARRARLEGGVRQLLGTAGQLAAAAQSALVLVAGGRRR